MAAEGLLKAVQSSFLPHQDDIRLLKETLSHGDSPDAAAIAGENKQHHEEVANKLHSQLCI